MAHEDPRCFVLPPPPAFRSRSQYIPTPYSPLVPPPGIVNTSFPWWKYDYARPAPPRVYPPPFWPRGVTEDPSTVVSAVSEGHSKY